jgi:lysophospholipase L1-like esterase
VPAYFSLPTTTHQQPVIEKPTAYQEAHADRISSWNLALHKKSTSFAERNAEATVLLFSAFTTFSNVLSDPVKYGFLKEDTKAYSGIWSDHVHPSGNMHAIVSKDVEAFLTGMKKEGQKSI